VTTRIYLERIDRARNMARYYRLSVVETLFGEYAMVREWGRIGGGGQSIEHVCRSEDEAERLLERHRAQRIGRGYR
jgi:predicted DNA-binding WGR domain protein